MSRSESRRNLAGFLSKIRPAALFRAEARPWLSILVLWVLFDLPSALHARGLSLAHFRPSADVLALLTLGGASYAVAWGRWLRIALVALTVMLVAYRIDEGVFGLLMHGEPLLYDQWFMLRHLFVLISDLASWNTALVVGGSIAAIFLGAWASVRLLRAARPLVAPERLAASGRVAYVAWLVVLSVSAVSALKTTGQPILRWVTPELFDNLALSRQTYESLSKTPRKSPYRVFDKITLGRKPDLKLFLVESYGRLLVRAKPTRDRYKERMQAMQARLEAAGWSMVSGYSQANVSGGRSWLAEGALLFGTPVRYESVFRHMVARTSQIPNLVTFLERQGYETVLMAPSDRERPGMRLPPTYPFDRYINFPRLGYKGPSFGWGIVPDQYSMGFLEEKVLPAVKKPLFVDFHFVTSHAPWDPLPRRVADYRELNAVPGKSREEKDGAEYGLTVLRRYDRTAPEYAYMGKLDGVLLARYEQAIYYELDVIESHLAKSHSDELVVVMGDHQPPVIASDKVSFDVPVHAFARDKKLLASFKSLGFSKGLVLSPNKPEVMSHGGMFSLLAHTLRSAGGGSGPVPVVRRDGYELTP